jgi:hypothetical protein
MEGKRNLDRLSNVNCLFTATTYKLSNNNFPFEPYGLVRPSRKKKPSKSN